MKVLRQLTWRYLKLNRKRTIVTVIGIILSAAMITGVATLVASFQDLFVRAVQMTDGSHHASFYEVPYENSKYITDHAYTQTAMLSKDIGFARLEGSKNEQKPYLMIKGYDREAFNHFPLTLKEGRFPEREGEIVISEEVFYEAGVEYNIGDQFTVEIGRRVDQGEVLSHEPLSKTEKLEVFTTETYTVTGIITRSRFESWESPGYSAISYLEESRLLPEERVNVSIVAVNPEQIFEQAPKLAEAAGALEIRYNNELLKWMGITQNERVINAMRSVGLIIILLIVVGSVTVIYNAFAISVSERTKQFGMLASVGATKRQIRRMVFWEGLIVGLIGLPVGILSGLAGIGVTLEVINHLMQDSVFNTGVGLRLIVSPETILVSVLFISLTIFLSVYIPAKKASKISPIEAIRLNREIRITGKTLRTSRLTRLLFGIEGELALKNLKRNKRRYRATLFSLFISIVLYISFSSFMTYGFVSSDIYYTDISHDFEVAKQGIGLEESLQFYDQVAQLDDVERFAVSRMIFSTAEEMKREQFGRFIQSYLESGEEGDIFRTPEGGYRMHFNLVAVGEEEFATYARELGLDVADYTNPGEIRGILVNRNVIPFSAEYKPLNIEAGERIALVEEHYGELVNPYRFTLEIGAVTNQLPLGVYPAQLGDVHVIVSEDAFNRIYQKVHDQSKETANFVRMYIKLKEGADRRAFAEAVRTLDAGLHPGPYLLVYDTKENQEELKRTKTMISIFLYGFVSLITLIGVTNIFNTISTNVALRRREFAMLKSVGLTPAGFNKMINYESIFYGLKALLYGLPVGILVSLWMHRSIADVFQFSFVLPWKEILVCIVGVFVIVFLTMLQSSAKLKKENIIDALKEENL
ncbi:putative ABC transport system permease protein [Caldalkalibacillus uzonensis]|uniref:ABC transport system permease protein n=1 Tax=Caldalkalibacillus uzonensis TaxID=353224 RepID=A0ABU0CXN9_9BACI|nr:ABC transporter permease [Caldalkalibacillus uzonensis]MDQ0340517.1 putative ABC transport system permease protein [Caldalkalibacillus uzonensis]